MVVEAEMKSHTVDVEEVHTVEVLDPMSVTPQKYPRIFIIILLYILGMN